MSRTAQNCHHKPHRKYYVAGFCLACLAGMKPREWSPLWREARWTLYTLIFLGIVLFLLMGDF